MGTNAQVITFINARGGSGQTTLSLNLAVTLKQESKGSVALIDFAAENPGLQQIPKLLGLETELTRSLEQLVNQTPEIDPQIIKGFLPSHPSGIDFITGIDTLTTGALSPAKLSSVMNALSFNYDYIVINLREFSTDDIFLSVIDNTKLIFIPFLPDTVSLAAVVDKCQLILNQNYPPQMIKILMNRSTTPGGLMEKEIRRFISAKLGMDLFYSIPEDSETVVLSINRSEPAVNLNAKSEYSRAVRDLGRYLNDENKKYYSEEREGIFNITGMPEHNFSGEDAEDVSGAAAAAGLLEKRINELKKKVHKRLVSELETQNMDVTSKDPAVKVRLHRQVSEMIRKVMGEEASFITDRELRKKVMDEIFHEAVGLGCLEKLLADPDITEIMVNNENTIYVEKAGKIQLSDEKFLDRSQLLTIIERIVAPLGRRIDEASPLVDGRLEDGSRVNAIIPPLALNGPTVTIRLFEEERLTTADLINYSSLTREMEQFLETCVRIHKNILIMGGTGSGKTTLLNMVASFIPHHERVLTIEDSAELQLPHEHWVRLESRPPNIEGGGAIPIQKLILNSLRMRPDRIVVGECRGGEALDMLQAMNTGHDGSLTTIHANSPQDAVGRLNTMVLMSGMELPRQAILEQIYGAINVIVHATRYSDGTRKVCSITDVTGFENGEIQMKEIMGFVQTDIVDGKIKGHFKSHGILPSFVDEIKAHGEALDLDIFKERIMETGPQVLTEAERVEIQRKNDIKASLKKGAKKKDNESPRSGDNKDEIKNLGAIETGIAKPEEEPVKHIVLDNSPAGLESAQFDGPGKANPAQPAAISPQVLTADNASTNEAVHTPDSGKAYPDVAEASGSVYGDSGAGYESPVPPEASPPQAARNESAPTPAAQQVSAEELLPGAAPAPWKPAEPQAEMSSAEERLKKLMGKAGNEKKPPDNNINAEELL